MKTVTPSELEANCLSILDEVEAKREVVTILRDGKPVARLVPAETYPRRELRGTVTILGDVVAPVAPADAPDGPSARLRERLADRLHSDSAALIAEDRFR
jgi:prevent-host-death family protein